MDKIRGREMKSKLADIILGMTHGDLSEVARDLFQMTHDDDFKRPLRKPMDYVELLHDWAEAQE